MAGDYLGGEAYWAGGLHLYTPLPFRPCRGGDLFRTHFFLNAGNLCNLNYGESFEVKQTLINDKVSQFTVDVVVVFFQTYISIFILLVLGSDLDFGFGLLAQIWEEITGMCFCRYFLFSFIICIFYICSGEGPQAHLKKLAECIRWSYGLGIVLRLGNIARLELNYCIPMGVQSGDR